MKRIAYFSNSRIPSQDANAVHVMKMTGAFDVAGCRVWLYAAAGEGGANIDEVARRFGLGEFVPALPPEGEPWPVNQDASHHIGTTRMGRDPRNSVVNTDCRLHTVEDVYLAGSSVFPTSGNANPTYTIVALAIRLADHLKAQIQPNADRISL